MSSEEETDSPGNTELERQIFTAARSGVLDAVKDSLTGYNRPLSTLAARVIDRNEAELDALINTGLNAVISDPSFGEAIKDAIRSKLARSLVGSMGGEIEKRINRLKSDPTTRARLTLALEAMINEISKGETSRS